MIFPDPPADKNLPKTLVACGKDGNIYLLNRQNMGGYNPAGPPNVLTHLPLQPGRPVPLNPLADEVLFPDGTGFQPGAFGGPAFFDNGEKQFVYYAGNDAPMTAFFLDGNSLEPAGIGVSGRNFSGGPCCSGGTTPVVSSNQNKEGIVWALLRFNPYAPQVILLAFDATDLTQELIAIPAGPWNNPKGTAFIEPTVINGRVYVASDGELRVFGL